MVDRKTMAVIAAGLLVGVVGGIAVNAVQFPLSDPSDPSSGNGSDEMPLVLYDVNAMEDWTHTISTRLTFGEQYASFDNGRMKIRDYGALSFIGPRWDSVVSYRSRPIPGQISLDTLSARGYVPDTPKSGLDMVIWQCSEDVLATPQFRENCEEVYRQETITEPGPVSVEEDLSHLTIDPVLVVGMDVKANTTETLPAGQEPYWDSFRLTRAE